jgi:hypothetical protein
VRERTRAALLASIAHWERMRDDPDCGETLGPGDCPLCGLYFTGARCEGCPVAVRAGRTGCWGTPYASALSLWLSPRDSRPGSIERWRAAAQAEIVF